MKKTITLLTLILASFTCFSQKKQSKEKIRAFKIAFLTDKLNLTEKEAEKFWPVYNAFNKKIIELRHKKRKGIFQKIKEQGGINNLSEEKSKKIMQSITELDYKYYETRKEYLKKLATIIPYKKQLILEKSEREFHKKLLRKLKNHKK